MASSSLFPNYEEAATVAVDFINSIDNLPKEVEHLLQEIKIKEQKCQDLLQDVTRDQARYIRSVLKPVAPAVPSMTFKSSMQRSPSSPPSSTSTDPSSPSKAHLPARIASAYAQIAVLNDEKVTLAHSLIRLLASTKSRLDTDLIKVRVLQGESPDDARVQAPIIPPIAGQLRSSYPSAYSSSASWMVSKSIDREVDMTGLGAVAQINESLRNVAAAMQIDGSAGGPGYNKKRRLTTNTSLKISSPAPLATSGATASRSRVSKQTRIAEEEEDLDPEADADAEGEDDPEGEDAEEEDTTLYCFCNKQSYGDMIGCDNPDCPYQWFHISCVGVKHPFPDKWYCPECSSKKSAAAAEKRKGRKK